MRRLLGVAAVCAAVCAAVGAAPALESPDAWDAPRSAAAALERRVEALERQLAERAPDPNCGGVAAAEAWRDRGRWRHLRRGMSRFDALRILGAPGVVASYDGFERWEYPDLRGGRLHFDELGVLIGWRMPREARAESAPP